MNPESKAPCLKLRISDFGFRISTLHCASAGGRKPRQAFTLIEIMIVMAIMGIIMTMGIPLLYNVTHKEALNKAIRDVVEVCSNARAQAIMQGRVSHVVFHPRLRTFAVEGGAAGSPAPARPEFEGSISLDPNPPPPRSGMGNQISEKVQIEMLDVNLTEYKDADTAKVRFFPNGTCDEMTLILHSDKGEWMKITLEITTGLTSVGPVTR